MHAVRALGQDYLDTFRELHDIVLAPSSIGKLARLLLSWAPSHTGEQVQAKAVNLRTRCTHEDMAQMIGVSRETVSRLLGNLKRSDVLVLRGATMVIHNVPALQALAQ